MFYGAHIRTEWSAERSPGKVNATQECTHCLAHGQAITEKKLTLQEHQECHWHR